MKNIHILGTENPSRLFEIDGHLIINREQLIQPKYYRNIYITSDEEIKEGSYVLGVTEDRIFQVNKKSLDMILKMTVKPNWKKIILTTDQDLIKDGVQGIDDEFLEWFVNNPSCEEVELGLEHYFDKNIGKSPFFPLRYKIIIPKEDPKQEQKHHIIDLMKLDEEPKTKCYCGHTTYCDCGPLEEPKQDCKHDIVIKYGVAECQNCGMEESEIVREEPKQVICYDKFDIVIKNGYYVDVQNSGIHRVYKKEDKQLYFTPYGKEERVSDYFSNDLACITYAGKLMMDLKREIDDKEQQSFTKPDDTDGQWLSPIPSERQWQEEQLINIFEHYPNASPKWQYMNGLIQNSLDIKEMYSEEELRNAMNWMLTQYFEFHEWPAMGRVDHYVQSIKQQEQ